MAIFQSILTLLLVAVFLLQVSRRLAIPYPTMLATAGLAVAALPWAPEISIDPRLVMALFIAPAILDAAYDFPPRAIRRYWLPLFALVVVAVLLTTAAVAWVGVVFGGLPVPAAVAMGAIVSPPDAAAAAAILNRPSLPRSTATVLKGESLLNDAVALFIFGAALRMTEVGDSVLLELPRLAFAIPGGLLLGFAMARVAIAITPFLAGTLGGIVFQFLVTFSTWIAADRLGLSAILAVVAAAMTVARRAADNLSASDRLHSNAVWSIVVFVLNVLAFLFVGLQAKGIVRDLSRDELWHAFGFASLVLVVVIVVRIFWVLAYNRLVQPVYRWVGTPAPTLAQGVVASWCGMRGMVTLAAALALPTTFPHRNLVLLAALGVVLGTLVLQGLLLEPLIRFLRFPVDNTFDTKLARAREALIDVAIATLPVVGDATTQAMRTLYLAERSEPDSAASEKTSGADRVRLDVIRKQRETLDTMRRSRAIDDETFRVLQKELDLSELAALRRDGIDLADD
jgi:Na+/H+ antiporter